MEYSNNRIIQIKKLDNNLNKIKLKYTKIYYNKKKIMHTLCTKNMKKATI